MEHVSITPYEKVLLVRGLAKAVVYYATFLEDDLGKQNKIEHRTIQQVRSLYADVGRLVELVDW